ncbi:MAG: histidine kinase [Acidimicrobiales bacterium]|nr:histidine kinase [Acidimicrobiales bacterium]
MAVVIGIAVFRTLRPIRPEPSWRRTVALTTEATVVGVACVATGFFSSPFAFSTLAPAAIAGFLGGFAISLRLASALALAIGSSWAIIDTETADAASTSIQWGGELLLVAIMASYARRISSEADERRTEALDRLGRLGDANELLYSLHQVAQELPSSLDLDEVLDSTLDRLRDLIDVETAVVVIYEESDQTWTVARRFGARLATTIAADELPSPLLEATRYATIVSSPNLLRAGGPGLSPRASSGLYAPLEARGNLVGALVIEHSEAFQFDARDTELLRGFAEPAALAIDNARWFARLRTVGADEERTRIARDLHDRIGQSLAYLAFELDRIVRKDERGVAVSDDLDGLRKDVRDVVREVRDTLYDLRTDVSDERTVGEVLEEFAERVHDRSGMTVVVRVDETGRVPRLQERELWRIAQEAIVNAERHSSGRRIDVFWFSNGSEAIAEVRDDGVGMPAGHIGRLDSYGMLGMRERASSIGATLSVESLPKRGVTVRATLAAKN